MITNNVQGKNAAMQVLVSGIYYRVDCEVDFSFEYLNELILKTDVNAGSYRKRRVRISDVTGTVQGVTTTSSETGISIFYFLQEAVRRSIQNIRFLFRSDDNVIKTIDAAMLIETIDLNGPIGDASKFDMKFSGGSGGIVIDPLTIPPVESNEGLDAEYWAAVAGDTTITGNGVNGKSFAGKTILEVSRTGDTYIGVGAFTGGGLEYMYDGTVITFEIPFNSGETVFVMWKD